VIRECRLCTWFGIPDIKVLVVKRKKKFPMKYYANSANRLCQLFGIGALSEYMYYFRCFIYCLFFYYTIPYGEIKLCKRKGSGKRKGDGGRKGKGGEEEGGQGWDGKFKGLGGKGREKGREKGRGGKIYGGQAPKCFFPRTAPVRRASDPCIVLQCQNIWRNQCISVHPSDSRKGNNCFFFCSAKLPSFSEIFSMQLLPEAKL